MTPTGIRRPAPVRPHPHELTSLEWLNSVLSVGSRISLSAGISHTDARGRPHQLLGWFALKDGRALLIPLDSAAAGIGSLCLYRPQKIGPRISRTLLILGLRAGLARYVLRRAGSLVQSHPLKNDDGATFLLDYLREAIAQDDALFAIHFGAPGPVRKPVIAIMSRQGQTLGFAKIGWNVQTVSLIENEKRSLDALAARPLQFGRFPKARHFARWNDRCVLITDPLPLQGGRRTDRRLRPLHVQFLIEIAVISVVRGSFRESGFFSRLRVRLDCLRDTIPVDHARILEKALDSLTASLGTIDIPWVWRLGDFTPWNTGIEKKAGRIACIDVEYADRDSIPGWDIFHFLRQAAGQNSGKVDIASAAQRDGLAYFEALSIYPRLIPTLYAAYLFDLYTLWAVLWVRHDQPLTSRAAETLAHLTGLLDESMQKQEAERAREQ